MAIITRVQVRRGFAADWTAVNPVLAQGELAEELDTGKTKIGDGTTPWVTLPYAVDRAMTGPGSAGRTKVINRLAGIGLRDFVSAADDPWLVAPDGKAVAFVNATGTTVSAAAAASGDAGKVLNVPGGGHDDGAGVKDGFSSVIASVTPGVSYTLTDTIPTTVNSGSNRIAAVATDYTTQINAFLLAIGTAGVKGYIPAGNIGFTGQIDFQPGLAFNKGLNVRAQGAGAGNTTATAATSFWYLGPTGDNGANGAGDAPMRAASTSGLYSLKLSGFGLQLWRALAVSTTVTGAGQVISTTPINLVVGSTAGMAAKGRVNVGGNFECQYTSIVDATHLAVVVVSGSYTTVGGETVRTVTAGLYWDNLISSDARDIFVAGYSDNTGSILNANNGRGVWMTNFSSGVSNIVRVQTRYFHQEDSWRFGTCNTGFGIRGNGGNCNLSTCTAFGTYGFYFQGSSLMDGNVFDALKAVGNGTAGSYAMLIDGGFAGNTWNSPHCENFFNGIKCNGQGNTFNGILASFLGAVAGDGSAAVYFTAQATSNIVTGGVWGGWSGGVPGTPTGTHGFSYGALFDAASTGNRVYMTTTTGFSVAGIWPVNFGGSTGNRFVDGGNPWDSNDTIIFTASNLAWPIPAGVQSVEVEPLGPGGSAGGGGSATTASSQVGGAGGTAAVPSKAVFAVADNKHLAVTLPNPANGGTGGTAGGGAGGQGNGGTGDTTVVGDGTNGLSVTGKRGGPGKGGLGTSTLSVNPTPWGQSGNAVGAAASQVTPGVGGLATSSQGNAGGDPFGLAGGGGAAGAPANAGSAKGGAAGASGTASAGGAVQTGLAGTTTGADAVDATAYGAGGGGGGGGLSGAAGGKGAKGGPPLVIVRLRG